uniref:DNA-directed DNA polymerase X domain-containing protein n=1 Tax=Neospora caninum (strain Liverpool) TaxID=572307 RepID=A0A0F7UIB9_NEOCL|nr:TPA: hypothetical protein BN1204_041190 [Neospora caninum Liverpool]
MALRAAESDRENIFGRGRREDAESQAVRSSRKAAVRAWAGVGQENENEGTKPTHVKSDKDDEELEERDDRADERGEQRQERDKEREEDREGRAEASDSDDGVEVTAIAIPLTKVPGTVFESLVPSPSSLSLARSPLCPGAPRRETEELRIYFDACKATTDLGRQPHAVARKQQRVEDSHARGEAESEEQDAETEGEGAAKPREAGKRHVAAQHAAEGRTDEGRKDDEADLVLPSASDTDVEELEKEGWWIGSSRDPGRGSIPASSPASHSCSASAPSASASSSFSSSRAASHAASVSPGGNAGAPETGDLTDFLVERLLFLSSKYEEHGEVWRATGFRIASGVIRQCSGAAFRAAEQARRASQTHRRQGSHAAPSSPATQTSENTSPGSPASAASATAASATAASATAASGLSPRARLRREGITRQNYVLLKQEPGIGSSIFQTIDELVSTGTTRRLQVLLHGERAAAREELQKVWGVGFHTAEKLIALGVHSVAALRRVVAQAASRGGRSDSPASVHTPHASPEEGLSEAAKKAETDGAAPTGQTLLHSVFGADHVDTYLLTGETGRGRGTPRGVHTPRPEVQKTVASPGARWVHGPARAGVRFASRRATEGEDAVAAKRQNEAARLLTRPQLTGLKYVEAFQKRIPREEVAAVADFIRSELGLEKANEERPSIRLRKRAKREQRDEGTKGDRGDAQESAKDERRIEGASVESWTDGLLMLDVCGSYRRGKAECGDIDILLIRRDNVPRGCLKNVISRLTSCGLLVDHLLLNALATPADPDGRARLERESSPLRRRSVQEATPAERKFSESTLSSRHSVAELYCGVCIWPPNPSGGQARAFVGPRLPRRIDIKIYPARCRAYALLYFTGSAQFNRSMRLWAKRLSVLLDDTGCYPRLTVGARAMQKPEITSPKERQHDLSDGDLKRERVNKDTDKEAGSDRESEGAPDALEDAERPSSGERERWGGTAVIGEEPEGREAEDAVYQASEIPIRGKGGNAVAGRLKHCATEEEIFDLLGLQFVQPNDREVFVQPKDVASPSCQSSEGSD